MHANFWITCGALANALGVALGAFGAHFFKTRLAAQELITYETSVRYLLIHAMALLALGLLSMRLENFSLKLAGWLFVAGIILFCGSLFLLITTKIKLFGAITPLGGLCFISAWLLIASSFSGIFNK